MNSFLITGASGFIGSHLAQRIVADGSMVHAIIRPTSNIDPLLKLKHNFTTHIHDGTSENMFHLIKDIKPKLVIHLAASFSKIVNGIQNIDELISSNILFGVQLVESMVKNNVNYLINTGTSWQHFQNKDYSPTCLYAASKQAFSDILQYYIEATNLNVLNLKLFHTYGPNDNRNKLFCQLRQAIKEKRTLKMTPGEQLVDIVYIDDVVNAYKVAIDRLITGNGHKKEEFVISSGNLIPLKELVRTYFEIKNEEENIIWGGKEYRPREDMKPYGNGKILPGWEPKVPLKEGFKIMEGIA